jgi:hypothetical protein
LSAQARPMPLPAPVTSATFPFPVSDIAYLRLCRFAAHTFRGDRFDRHRHARPISSRTIQQRIGKTQTARGLSARFHRARSRRARHVDERNNGIVRGCALRTIHSLPAMKEGALEAR